MQTWISVSQPFFLKSCLCLFWPLRAAFKARFLPVISVVVGGGHLPVREGDPFSHPSGSSVSRSAWGVSPVCRAGTFGPAQRS